MPDPSPQHAGRGILYKWWLYVSVIVVFAAIYLAWPTWSARVADMIPGTLAEEGWQNAEPTLAIDPTDPTRMAASAMFLGSEGIECGALTAGVVASANSGKTWHMQCVLPLEGDAADNIPDWAGDHSFDAVGSGNKTYAAYLTPGYVLLARILEADIAKGIAGVPRILQDFKDTDQPHIDANRGAGSDEYSVSASMSEGTSGCADDGTRDAVVYAGTGTPSTPTCFQQRSAVSEIPAARSAWHSSGTVYTVYYLPVDWTNRLTDVVVAKATKGASGAITYGAIDDSPVSNTGDKCTSRDGLPGFRLARCVVFPWNPVSDPNFGQERRTLSQLSVAVDPNDANVVYVAWGDISTASPSLITLHVRASRDGGVTWDVSDLTTVTNATNPTLAVNSGSEVGFAYQQLAQRDGNAWWDTIFILARPDFLSTRRFVLAQTRADTPLWEIMPYLGDYMDLETIGTDFYGVFSANNKFAANVYPQGLTYQRKPGGSPVMLGFGLMVPVSIDPYFFAIERQSPISRAITAIAKWLAKL